VKVLICFTLALASLTAADEPPPQSGDLVPIRDHHHVSKLGRRPGRARPQTRCQIEIPVRIMRPCPPASRHDQQQPSSRAHSSARCDSCKRDACGRIVRSALARRQFQRENPCPATGRTTGACPGYVVDHIVALKHGGSDEPANMQWQTATEAGTKGKIE